MDYVEGESLSAYLKRKGTLSERELKGILDPLLSALEVVHGADFLHRDIKPANIILRAKDASPVLLDFGAARQAMGAKSRSVTSIVTPGYAPIEQYSTRAAQGAWTDIYALGGVCYRALTGEIPFDATDRMRNDPLVPVAERCAGKASPEFLGAIDAALGVDAHDRPQSIAAWREVLRGADGAQEAPPSKPWKNLPYKRLAAVLGLVALLIGGQRYVEHAEEVAQEEKRQKQAALEKHAQEQAAREKRRQEEVALEKQQREKAALEEKRQERAALEKQAQEQAAREKRRQEEAALEKQQREKAALEKQRQERAALEKQQREQAALEKQRQEEAALEEQRLERQRQEQAFVAEVGRPPHPGGMNEGDTDLHVAARLKLPLLTVSLVEQGADVNARNKDGWTPLHVAAREDASAAAAVLLEQGADANARETLFGWTPLHLAAAKGDASATAEVLLSHKADVQAKDKFGWTPLHSAASNNAHETAEVLLNSGADANAMDNHGWGPLYWASRKEAVQAAEVLRRYGGRE